MKNILRNKVKNFDLSALPNILKRVKHWNILFVDNQGKVLSFQYVKWLLLLFTFLLLTLLSILAYMYVIHKGYQKKNSDLQNALELSRRDLRTTQEEMRSLMVRLAKAQSGVPKGAVENNAKPAIKEVPVTKPGKSSVVRQTKAETDKSKNVQSKQTGPSLRKKILPMPIDSPSEIKPERQQLKKEKTQAASIKKIKPVGVYDLTAFYNSKQGTISLRFLIKKVNKRLPCISGHIFAVMKQPNNDNKEWVPIPAVDLVLGKPSRIKAGRYFKICNFKTVKLRSGKLTGPKDFNKVTLLVFGLTGNKLLEKTFPVNIHVAGVPKEVSNMVPVAEKPPNDL